MNTKNHSLEIIRYSIPANESALFEKAYTEAAIYLKASAYCLGYELLHGTDEPENYILVINWTSREEHMRGFRNSEEFLPFFNLIKKFYNNIKEMKHYDKTPLEWSRK